jgi:uncharacterized protein YukE
MRGDDLQPWGTSGRCGHDAALLRNAGVCLERAQSEVSEGQSASDRAAQAEWSGAAAESYRARTAYIAAELAAVAAGLVALGALLSSLEGEARECEAARSVASAASPSPDPPRFPITPYQGPAIPHPPAEPVLPYEPRPKLLPYQISQEACR